jgi:hypothetical protein
LPRNEALDQVTGERVGRSVGPAPGADLRDVAFDGPDAHKQLFGDLVVGLPASQVAQHLPRRKTVRIASGRT